MAETNQLLKTIQETKSDGLSTLMESLDNLTFSKYLKETLYLIFDYPYKYYTFKHFEV